MKLQARNAPGRKKTKVRGVEHESRGWRTPIQRIAQDRVPQPVAGVDAELVRASGDGAELDAGAIGLAGQDAEVRDRGASLNVIDDLIGPVGDIEPHGQVDRAFIIADEPGDKSDVSLFGLAIFELERELALRIGIERNDHQARGVHVETVDDQLAESERGGIGFARVERGVHARDDAIGLLWADARDGENAAGFFDHDEPVGAVDDAYAGENGIGSVQTRTVTRVGSRATNDLSSKACEQSSGFQELNGC